ncbi:hypothetical protein QLX08_003200 [Tetragonisca angustula]|uniref:Uncharacterized protein n=1 Tax=Tetragonisca angustula TaxID=166442 RepID=A0AAW1AA97_9HYME
MAGPTTPPRLSSVVRQQIGAGRVSKTSLETRSEQRWPQHKFPRARTEYREAKEKTVLDDRRGLGTGGLVGAVTATSGRTRDSKGGKKKSNTMVWSLANLINGVQGERHKAPP